MHFGAILAIVGILFGHTITTESLLRILIITHDRNTCHILLRNSNGFCTDLQFLLCISCCSLLLSADFQLLPFLPFFFVAPRSCFFLPFTFCPLCVFQPTSPNQGAG